MWFLVSISQHLQNIPNQAILQQPWFRIRLLWILQEQLWIASLSNPTGAQERVLASRQGGAKERDKISNFNIIDIYMGKLSSEKAQIKPSSPAQPVKAPLPPSHGHWCLFYYTGSEKKGTRRAERRKSSLDSHVKYFQENAKVLETLSILPDLPNCANYQNAWETSKIPSALTFLFPKWAQGLDFLRALKASLERSLLDTNWRVPRGVQEKQLHYY